MHFDSVTPLLGNFPNKIIKQNFFDLYMWTFDVLFVTIKNYNFHMLG